MINYNIWDKICSKSDSNNCRGVFKVMIVKSVIDHISYNYYNDIIDHNMSDSNGGDNKRQSHYCI